MMMMILYMLIEISLLHKSAGLDENSFFTHTYQNVDNVDQSSETLICFILLCFLVLLYIYIYTKISILTMFGYAAAYYLRWNKKYK